VRLLGRADRPRLWHRPVAVYLHRTGEIENGHVEVQLKATDHLRLSADGRTIAFRLDVRDLNHWSFEPMPVIFVVFDAGNDRAYWLHVQNYVAATKLRDADEGRDPATVSVRVPAANRLSIRAMRKFREFKEGVLAEVRGGTGHGR
jgi:Domain of unknown function (DUF4365)